MSYLQLSVVRTDGNGNDTDITYDVETLTIKRGMDQKANTTTLTLKNPLKLFDPLIGANVHEWVKDSVNFTSGFGELVWEENDAITVKAKFNEDGTVLTESDILTVSDALEFSAKLEQGRSNLVIKAVDKTFNILNQQVARAFTVSSAKNPPEIIKQLLEEVSENGNGDGTFGITANLMTEGTYIEQRDSSTPGIQTRRIDNSAFPDVALSKVYKPLYEWIDDLSTIEFTNVPGTIVQNRKMRYYLDKDNNFRWFYPDDKVDYTLVVGSLSTSDDDVKSYNLNKSTFDIVNFVIYNGGLDLNGVGTLNYFFDTTTQTKQLLTKYKAYTDIAPKLIQDELTAGNLVANTSGSFTFQGNRYNRNGTVTPTWSSTSVSTDDDYNDSLRTEIKRLCDGRAQAFTKQRGNPRWKGTIVLSGRNFLPGENLSLTSYIHGINQVNIRIVDVTHSISANNWTTTLNLEEDDDKVATN
jgi:hypothetical protein